MLGIAEQVEQMLEAVDNTQGTLTMIPILGALVTALLGLIAAPVGVVGLGATLAIGFVGLLSRRELELVQVALRHVPADLRRAAAEGVRLNDVARILLEMVDKVDVRGLLGQISSTKGLNLDDLHVILGLDGPDLKALVQALGGDGYHAAHTRSMPPGWAKGQPVPMILLARPFSRTPRRRAILASRTPGATRRRTAGSWRSSR